MEIRTAEFLTSMAEYREASPISLPQLAVVGRSNVGKSTMINTLCRQSKLCRTSATPGKTRLINVFRINGTFHLIDLPGYGYAQVDKKEKLRWGEMMEKYFQESTLLFHVLLLADIRHEPSADDIAMANYFRKMDIPFTVIATKADKISRGARLKYLAPLCRGLMVQPWQVIPFSGENGTGREEVLRLIGQLLDELKVEKD